MKRKAVSKEYLKRITQGYCIAMAEQAPDTFDRDIMYPDSFIQKMKDTFKKYRRYEFIQTTKKCIAAVFAALVIGSGVWLSVDVDARAAVVNWVRQIYENSIVYKYFGEKETNILPKYELQYIPDGLIEIDKLIDTNMYYVCYINPDTDDVLVFEYSFISNGSAITVQDLYSNINPEKFFMDGYDMEFYDTNGSSDANSLVWFDDKNGLMFHIDSNMDRQVMLHIFQNIVLVDSTK